MTENNFLTKALNETILTRRSFIKWSAALGGTALASGGLKFGLKPVEKIIEGSDEEIFRTSCPAHNCGGRCLLVVTRKNGVITHIAPDDRTSDDLSQPQLRACVRGLSYLRRQYHPNRLKYPLKRVGRRGEGNFERISWDEALDTIVSEFKRVKAAYGNGAFMVRYGTGSWSNTNGHFIAHRLMSLYGGFLGYYNNYSWAAMNKATPYVYGTTNTGGQRQGWLDAKIILMWGWNPAETIDGTNSAYFIKQARARGARVVCIDPRMSLSAVSLADEWIPIRPGTDVAMMSAMAYVMLTEGLYDKEFVSRYCVGFDSSQMVEGVENEETYEDYILGKWDGVAKTPEWAEAITNVPSETIARIAREYATTRPGVLYQGYGMQRRAYGEEVVRAGCVLAAITGNVGVLGGWASGMAFQAPAGPNFWIMAKGDNPIKAAVPVFHWREAVERGVELGPADGLIGADKLDTNVKLLWAVGCNNYLNQHSDINQTAEMLADESKLEFILSHDQFMTSSNRFADLILPVCTHFEVTGLADGWKYGDEILLSRQVVDPPFESKSDYQICAELAERLGIYQEFTEGRDERGWVDWCLEQYRKQRFPQAPTLAEMEASNAGVYSVPVEKPGIAFAAFREDPIANPLSTPSGKIEIFSKALFDMGRPDEIPAVPKYIQEWESPFGPEAERYPLQVIGHHFMSRVHSTHDNNDWLREAFPQRVFINSLDAEARGIADGDLVKVYNDRGAMIIPCRLTERILPGVIDVPQGAWWMPDESGVDRRGNVNVLTSERPTPLAHGNAQHTIMAQVEKA